MPRYKEVNPGIFTIITFPFLFGVMYGDIGHGSLLLLFGIYLCLFKESIKKGSFAALLPARYMLTLMGCFALYCGFIYNDFMSIPLNFFSSCFTPTNPQPYAACGGGQCFMPKHAPLTNTCVYGFGIDPIWSKSNDYISFINSFKMKISVIIGVI